ncbi:hypothetical protein [Halioxenophilus sp. WMMB6]|uniref:hypothetical protein n=1 Tax=Halioxenophilus sp. WMMB6 TaxID=3073815 RepID=UPI00295ED07B|nr:hypothetical protein [Halioxenophilus sp. WMMB6]
MRAKKLAVALVLSLSAVTAWAQQHNSENNNANRDQMHSQREMHDRSDCGNNQQCLEAARKEHMMRMEEMREERKKEMEACKGDKSCVDKLRSERAQERDRIRTEIENQCGDDKECRRNMLQQHPDLFGEEE